MAELSAEKLRKWKEVFAKSGIRYKTDDEYREAIHNLVGYFDVLIQMDLQQKEAQREPKKQKQKNAKSKDDY